MDPELLVISLEQAVAAPLCSRRLADFGARVVKIEPPEGDFARRYDRVVRGQSAYFVWLNRGKESISLDLRRRDDLALLEAMVRRADVFIHNLRPGGLADLGIDLAGWRHANQRLITCTISGYGAGGPYAARKAYDLLVQAARTHGPEPRALAGVRVPRRRSSPARRTERARMGFIVRRSPRQARSRARRTLPRQHAPGREPGRARCGAGEGVRRRAE